MKTIATFILSMFIGFQFLAAQDQQVASKEKAVSWSEITHDFGKIAQGDPASVTFTMTNKSQAPVIITAAKSSCGCTVAEYTKEPVKPGETGIVKATYNSARVGPFTKTVTVTLDGMTNPEVLTIKGEVEAKSTE